jgi:hypothetical protein
VTAAARRLANPARSRVAAVSLLLTLWWIPAAAHAAAPPAALAPHLAGVASPDADAQDAAVTALGQSGDRLVLPLLEALREGSVYVRTLPDGRPETVIAGDKVTEGDRTLVPLYTAYGREPIAGVSGWCCVRSSTASPPRAS